MADIWLNLNLDVTIGHLYDLGLLGASVFTSLIGKGKYLPRGLKKNPLQIVKCYEDINADEIHDNDDNDDDDCMSVLSHF